MGNDSTSRLMAIAKEYDQIAESIKMSDGFYKKCIGMARRPLGRVLDVACGQGRLLELAGAANLIAQSTGLDISHRFCQYASKVNPGQITQADAAHLPYQSQFFDTIFITESLEHMLFPDHVVSEIKRVLRPDGQLIISVPNRGWIHYASDMKQRRAIQPVDDHWYNLSELRNLLEPQGFEVLNVDGYERLLFRGGRFQFLDRILTIAIPSLRNRWKRLLLLCIRRA